MSLLEAGYVSEARRRLAALDSITKTAGNRLFVTLSGAHLFGFPSVDSDYDLRGVYEATAYEVWTREAYRVGGYTETIEHMGAGDMPDDLVLHEARKIVGMLLKSSGSALEQIMSPLVVETSEWHRELVALAPQAVNVRNLNHYLGFFKSQLGMMRRRPDKQVKVLLYVFRVLMTGIHLARTGTVEANIVRLNEHFRLAFVNDLIAQKVSREEGTLSPASSSLTFYEQKYEELVRVLEDSFSAHCLPSDIPDATVHALKDWLYRLRLTGATIPVLEFHASSQSRPS
jgi:predicted nucleotidyltransferase